MKRNLFVLPVLLLSLFLASPASAVLVGKVNIQRVLQEVEDAKKAKEKLQKMAQGKQEDLKKQEKRVRQMRKDFKKQSLVLNDKKKAEKQREIQKSIMEIQQKSRKFQQKMKKREEELKAPILKRIKKIVDDVSKKADVDMTFEVSVAPVIYAKESKDLTDEVIKEYNKRH